MPFMLSHAFCTVIENKEVRFSDDELAIHPERFLKLRVDDVLVRSTVKGILNDLDKGYQFELDAQDGFNVKQDKRDPEVVKKAKSERAKMAKRIEQAMRPQIVTKEQLNMAVDEALYGSKGLNDLKQQLIRAGSQLGEEMEE